jgi:hypothetical protein
MVALAVCVPLITAVIVVAGQEPPPVLELEEPEPAAP